MRSRKATSTRLALEQRHAADRLLQGEIDLALESLTAGVPSRVGSHLVRVLCAVLEPSWEEHASFQEDVLFEIMAANGTPAAELRTLLEHLRREHVEIGKRNRETAAILGTLAGGRQIAGTAVMVSIEETLTLRRRHASAESTLEHLLPAELEPHDCDRFDRWAAARTTPAFPVNLILDVWE